MCKVQFIVPFGSVLFCCVLCVRQTNIIMGVEYDTSLSEWESYEINI